ncbi:hypothetical protein JCM10213v2_001494 [Rhodosporidiobolus nylandii]
MASSTPPSPPPRPVPLPLDIYAEVLDHLADELPSPTARDALAACCLASKDFHHLAYPLLHQCIVLYVELKDGGDDLVHTFTKCSMQLALRLAGSPRLTARVRHLTLQAASTSDTDCFYAMQIDQGTAVAWKALAEQLPAGLSLQVPTLPSALVSTLESRGYWFTPAALMHKVWQLEVEWLFDIDQLQAVPSLRTLSLDNLGSYGPSPTITPPPVTQLASTVSYRFSKLDIIFRHLGGTLTQITLSIPLYSDETTPDLSLVPGLATLTIILPIMDTLGDQLSSAKRGEIVCAVERLLATAAPGGARSRFSLKLRAVDEADEKGSFRWTDEPRLTELIEKVKSDVRFSRVGEVDATGLGLSGGEGLEEMG